MRKGNKKAFTFIELMIIVAIIGILTVMTLVLWGVSAQKKAAVNSYKTSMKSVQTTLEFCTGTSGTAVSGAPTIAMCAGVSQYPTITTKCGPNGVYYRVWQDAGLMWHVTTYNSGNTALWNCKGCRLDCTSVQCTYNETSPGDCE